MTPHVLLLTDIVDSTKLTERLRDADMAALWTRHDRLARDLLAQHGGREMDRAGGFLLLFPTATDAVAYALAYHRAIGALDLRARIGLHVGPLALRENTAADIARGAKPLEVEGLAKPIAARVLALAKGGQTLLTEDARAALGTTRFRIETHGHWRLKGVSEPLEVFEVGDASAPFTPPLDAEKAYRVVRDGDRWIPAREVRHSLPRERDAFVGREADLQHLARLLDEGAALLTVLGTGGTGKTRLVTHYAWTWLGDWPGGAWFCDLSEARGIDGIASAVAGALDVPLGKDDPVVQLGHAIAGRGKCLVILDNFEQVARFAPDTLGSWLVQAPQAQFVVTTREVLGLPGEATLALAPLPAADGLALFIARAAQAKHDFTLSDTERQHVAALAKLLDGLPLAIELAAVRVRTMEPGALLQRMSERFKLLSSSGGRHTRHTTLRATLDWSWDLLAPDEQEALAQLSVFEGGFTLAAAEAVLSLVDAGPAGAVTALVDKSLVRRVSGERLDLLVSVQEYASEKLDKRGGRDEAEARHGAHFATFGAEDALEALNVHGGTELRRALGCELDNLTASCRRAVRRGDAGGAVATLCATWQVLSLRGPLRFGVQLAEEVAPLAALGPETRSLAERTLGEALRLSGSVAVAVPHLETALGLSRELGDRRGEIACLVPLGTAERTRGRPEEARSYLERALPLAHAVGSRRLAGLVLHALAILHRNCGRIEEALAHQMSALDAFRATGDSVSDGLARNGLGNLAWTQGRLAEARVHYEAALSRFRAAGQLRLEAIALGNLGVVGTSEGRADEARQRIEAALALHRSVGDRGFEGVAELNLGILDVEQGRWDEATTHLEAALAHNRASANHASEGLTLGHLGNLHRAQGRWDLAREHLEGALALLRPAGEQQDAGLILGFLGRLCVDQGRNAEARTHLDAGEAGLRGVGSTAELGMLLCIRARLEHSEGHPEEARAALAEAIAIADASSLGPPSPLGRAIAKAGAALEAP